MNCTDTKNIYIVLTQTGTLLSRIIKFLTQGQHNHASIGFDEELNYMYSFGRKNAYNPFFGGMVKESVDTGTFKRFTETTAKIICLPIPSELHSKMVEHVEMMCKNKKNYRYNYLGLYLAAVHIHWQRQHSYYCSQFVKDILLAYGIEGANKLKDIIHPTHFLSLPNTSVIYEGLLREYSVKTTV